MMPQMAPYQTIEMVAVVKISPTAKLNTRSVGLKVASIAGDMTEGGDYDSSPSWQGENLDSNEFIVILNLKAPDLVIKEIIVSQYSAEIDSTIPIGITLQNVGNTHATDIEIVLCQYNDVNSQSIINDIKNNGCDEDSIVMRQVVGALLAPDASEDAKEIEIYLLYPVVAGSKGVYVVVDPMNEIVEASENNNIKAVSEPLESPSPFFDVAGQIVAKTALPFVVILLTLSLLGVVYFVGKARREEVKKRIAEQSSLSSVLGSED
jgi:subtilase family serine protease